MDSLEHPARYRMGSPFTRLSGVIVWEAKSGIVVPRKRRPPKEVNAFPCIVRSVEESISRNRLITLFVNAMWSESFTIDPAPPGIREAVTVTFEDESTSRM